MSKKRFRAERPECLKNLREALEEGCDELEHLGGFCYVDSDQFIRDVRTAIKLLEPVT